MTSRTGLIALNMLLLAIFAASSFVPETIAQTPKSGHYIAIPAKTNGLSAGVIYIMDTEKQELVAVTWDHNRNRIATLGYRNIEQDAIAAWRN
ncbi:MAG: hypothetical protein VX436_04000 [Planctomycetota bacterium]|nr:hypothetical protein [Planctomycetota bacterium]